MVNNNLDLDGGNEMKGKYCIVRSENAGVFAGTLISEEGQAVVLKDSRWIWYWDGAATINELANRGTSKPENCKFPAEVAEVKIFEVIQIIPCTEKAKASIKGVAEWTSH